MGKMISFFSNLYKYFFHTDLFDKFPLHPILKDTILKDIESFMPHFIKLENFAFIHTVIYSVYYCMYKMYTHYTLHSTTRAELRQYKNEPIKAKKLIVLKLPRFSLANKGKAKARQFQN